MSRLFVFGAVGVVSFLGWLMISGSWLPARPNAANPAAPSNDLRDDEDPKSILHKAIAAHGGAEKLDNCRVVRSKFTGYYLFQSGRWDFAGDQVYQRPDKLKHMIRLTNGCNQLDVTTVFNGKTLWYTDYRQLHELTNPRIIEVTRKEFLLDCYALGEFLNEPYELTNIGGASVNGDDAVGIRVAKTGEDDIAFYFDKKTHLIAKTKARTYDGETKRIVGFEQIILGYQEKDGIQIAKRAEVWRSGQLWGGVEITEVRHNSPVNESVFTKP